MRQPDCVPEGGCSPLHVCCTSLKIFPYVLCLLSSVTSPSDPSLCRCPVVIRDTRNKISTNKLAPTNQLTRCPYLPQNPLISLLRLRESRELHQAQHRPQPQSSSPPSVHLHHPKSDKRDSRLLRALFGSGQKKKKHFSVVCLKISDSHITS